MNHISTHILDISIGKPVPNCPIELLYVGTAQSSVPGQKIQSISDNNGRTEHPLLEQEQLPTGWYVLTFSVRSYFEKQGVKTLWDTIPVHFEVQDGSVSYHIPLLISPWGYSTYRGS